MCSASVATEQSRLKFSTNGTVPVPCCGHQFVYYCMFMFKHTSMGLLQRDYCCCCCWMIIYNRVKSPTSQTLIVKPRYIGTVCSLKIVVVCRGWGRSSGHAVKGVGLQPRDGRLLCLLCVV